MYRMTLGTQKFLYNTKPVQDIDLFKHYADRDGLTLVLERRSMYPKITGEIYKEVGKDTYQKGYEEIGGFVYGPWEFVEI